MSGLRVDDDRLDSPAAGPLVRALWLELLERYGEPDPDPDQLTAADLGPPDGAFVVASLDDTPIGCGGIRRYGERIGELKRMYVVPGSRGRGVGRAVLAGLEARARALGYGQLVLETGLRQPEAMTLYASAGYEPTESYGFYRDAPLSRSFTKRL